VGAAEAGSGQRGRAGVAGTGRRRHGRGGVGAGSGTGAAEAGSGPAWAGAAEAVAGPTWAGAAGTGRRERGRGRGGVGVGVGGRGQDGAGADAAGTGGAAEAGSGPARQRLRAGRQRRARARGVGGTGRRGSEECVRFFIFLRWLVCNGKGWWLLCGAPLIWRSAKYSLPSARSETLGKGFFDFSKKIDFFLFVFFCWGEVGHYTILPRALEQRLAKRSTLPSATLGKASLPSADFWRSAKIFFMLFASKLFCFALHII